MQESNKEHDCICVAPVNVYEIKVVKLIKQIL